MGKRKTKSELVLLIEKRINKEFGGNKGEAARVWGELPAVMYEVLGERRSPTRRILDVMGYHKTTSVFYVENES